MTGPRSPGPAFADERGRPVEGAVSRLMTAGRQGARSQGRGHGAASPHFRSASLPYTERFQTDAKPISSAARGRAANRLRINPTIIHYDPDTGRLLWRFRPVKGKERLDWNEGWFQSAWPQTAVAKCPAMDLGGVAVDERQTGATLEELRRQAPDAALKGLAPH